MEEDIFEKPEELWMKELHINRDPVIWKRYAISLKNTGDLIYKKRNDQYIFPNTERMLFGLSLEIMAKAVLLCDTTKSKEYISENSVNWSIPHHKLIQYFEKANVEMEKNERRILNLYSMCISWAGRYPLPMNPNKQPKVRKSRTFSEIMEKTQKGEDVQFSMTTRDMFYNMVSKSEYEIYFKLFTKLDEKFSEEYQK